MVGKLGLTIDDIPFILRAVLRQSHQFVNLVLHPCFQRFGLLEHNAIFDHGVDQIARIAPSGWAIGCAKWLRRRSTIKQRMAQYAMGRE